MKAKLNDTQQMTRDRLKEVIEVNFNLFKDEPHFFDYITDLVINLMQYEYMGGSHVPTPLPEDFWDKKKLPGSGGDLSPDDPDNKPLPINDMRGPAGSGGRAGGAEEAKTGLSSLGERVLHPNRIVSRPVRQQGSTCPHCTNSIKPDARICPFCLAMLGKS